VIFRISCRFSADAEAVIIRLRRSRGPDVAVRDLPASTTAGRRARPHLRSVPQRLADTDADIRAYFAGLAGLGIDLAAAGVIIGTSAGSVAGTDIATADRRRAPPVTAQNAQFGMAPPSLAGDRGVRRLCGSARMTLCPRRSPPRWAVPALSMVCGA
jgi:hypothetical protein